MRRAAVLAALLVAACSGVEPIVDCTPERGIELQCGFHNPEDLVVLPEGNALLVSQYGAMGAESGSLALFDPDSGSIEVLFPSDGDARSSGAHWGEDDCPGPPGSAFSPHGIDLLPRAGGGRGLLVVNHGGRESVELFEVTGSGAGTRLEWRGCAVPPEGSFMNDVAALPAGGFVVTHMWDGGQGFAQLWQFARASFGLDTGYVLEWDREGGWRKVHGTDAPMPNGIQVSADGSEIFLDVYASGEVRRISRATGELLAKADVPAPDNASWSRDGRLLVASHTGPLSEMLACNQIEAGACPIAFEIVSLDPVTLEGGPIFANAGPPMGGGTVAVHRGDELFIGSFAGDRIARVPYARP